MEKIEFKCGNCDGKISDTTKNMKKKIKKYICYEKGTIARYHGTTNPIFELRYKKDYYGKGIKCPICKTIIWIEEPLVENDELKKEKVY